MLVVECVNGKSWAAEVEQQKELSAADRSFFLQLAQLAAVSSSEKNDVGSAKSHEAINHNLGAFSTTRRLQPRSLDLKLLC